MTRNNLKRVVVLGSGNFGTCLAQHLSLLGHEVFLSCRSKDLVESINQNHRNNKYLKDIELAKNLKAFLGVDKTKVLQADALVFAIPTQFIREFLEEHKDLIQKKQLLISTAKGIEIGSQKFPLDIFKDCLGAELAKQAVCLSGPSFAIEVASGQPTGVTAASYLKSAAEKAQELFHAPYFRVYTSDDPRGLEIAGALKNIIAIAAGACDGLGFGRNSLATLITRGLAEICRYGQELGANPLTFQGLSGVGDLFLTCSSVKSRNYTLGSRLGRGETLDHVLKTMSSVVEGVTTTKAAFELAKKFKVEAPITCSVYEVLFEGKKVSEAAKNLMLRAPSAEF